MRHSCFYYICPHSNKGILGLLELNPFKLKSFKITGKTGTPNARYGLEGHSRHLSVFKLESYCSM
jgi:hypothetical protein